MVETKGLSIGRMIGFALGVYVLAYVVLDAVLAVANKSGFNTSAGGTLGTLSSLATTVLPILLMVGAIWLLYKNTGLE